MRDIAANEGIAGLMRGHSVTLLRIFPYAGIKFMMYEQFKAVIMPTKEQQTGFRKFISGSLAGCSAVIVTYPFDLLRVRLAYESKGLIETIRLVANENRLGLGFYRGIVPTIVGMVPYAGISFYTYESLKIVAAKYPVFRNDSRLTNLPLESRSTQSSAACESSDLKPTLTHLTTLSIGAVSGMIAQTFSYPLEVIRRRMQVGNGSMMSTAKDIYLARGARGFFVGLGIGYIKVTPMFAISFFSYEYFKRTFGIV